MSNEPPYIREGVGQRMRTLLTDLTDAELMLVPGLIDAEIRARVDRARRDVESTQRELERKRLACEETLKRFKVQS